MSEFVHLHLHSQYSLLDGAIHLKKLFPAISEKRMDSVALTDHGYMYGTLDFYLKAKASGIKPIIGCEAYITSDKMEVKTNRNANYHLILLAKNFKGFQNLQYMISMAAIKGFYYKPRIDHELLKQYSDGIVACSACLGGEIPRTYFAKGYDAAKEMAKKYASYFEKDSFFLELQDNGIHEQNDLNEQLIKISSETGIPLVATNDCHYINREDAHAQDVLMAIAQGKKLSDEKRMSHSVDAFYIKSPEEMMTAFGSIPQAIENTVKIAEMCNVDIPNNVSRGKAGDAPVYFLPQYSTPDAISQEDFLRSQSKKGLEERFEEMLKRGDKIDDKKPYYDRLEMELNVIINMGFPGYFLIVADFIQWAKSQDIPVGPGRGSGAGSIVAYALRITELDPLKYDLIFERFLNPERISMPDFDVDFCKNRRDEVLNYVKEKYGEDYVAQIATFSTLKSRVVIRDVGRVMGIDLRTVDKVAKTIPMNTDLEEALEIEPKLNEMAKDDTQIGELIDVSKKLEGMYRHPGVHAAGVVISNKPIWEVVPATKGRIDAKGVSAMQIPLVTQYDKSLVEEASLVKFDFLGLDNLTKIQDAVKRINRERTKNGEELFDINLIPLDDQNVFKMIAKGHTGGVFQMESEGFSRLLQGLKPDRFEDLIAAVALYRPGPLSGGMVTDFIKYKHSGDKITYLHPNLEEVLSETYGVFVYQEQVMMAGRVLAGFSMGKADEMRKAMGKKLADKMNSIKTLFVKGCAERDISEKIANEIWAYMVKFAEYGFNKSHSAAYALISYQTAYLRCYYPVEFIAGILSCERSKPDKVMKYLQVARKMNLKVLPPDINESFEDFTIIHNQNGDKVIRFGLGAIKGVGDSAVQAILEARKDTSFESIFDLCKKVDLRRVNKGVIEALAKSGAMDALIKESPEKSRAIHIATIEIALKIGNRFQKDQKSNQISLFGMLQDSASEDADPDYPEVDPWTKQDMFKIEKDVLGIYLSGHPLEAYMNPNASVPIKEWNYSVGELQELENNKAIDNERIYIRDIITIGIVSSITERRTREKKELYAQGEIDGLDGVIGFFVSSKNLQDIHDLLLSNEPLLFYGALEISSRDGAVSKTLRVNKVERIAEIRKKEISNIKVKIEIGNEVPFFKNKLWEMKIKNLVEENPGEVKLNFLIEKYDEWETIIQLEKRIKLSDKVVGFMEQNFGNKNISYLKSPPKL